MKKILVPTDFSKNSETALYYALELAKSWNAQIILLNAYQIGYSNSYVSFDIVAEEKATARKESEDQLKVLSLKIKEAGEIPRCISLDYAPVDAILELTKKEKIDMIVMGTKGASGLVEVVFGSNAAKVIEKAECPVIAVPEQASFKKLNKITYATDYNYADINALKKLVEIAKPVNAQINILHITIEPISAIEEKRLMETFMKEIGAQINYLNTSYQLKHGASVEKVLEDYMEADSTSMLAMSTHYRNIFNKIFSRSITKHMAYQTKIPLLAFHYKSKTTAKIK